MEIYWRKFHLNFEQFGAHRRMMAAEEQPLDAEFALVIYGSAFSLSSRSFLSHSKGNGTHTKRRLDGHRAAVNS